MKLTSFLLPALAGLAFADDRSRQTEVYLIRQTESQALPSTPSLSFEVAQAIIRQRLFRNGDHVLPAGLDDEAILQISKLGVPARPLFYEGEWHEPYQLVVMVKGVDEINVADLKKALPQPDFTAPTVLSFPAMRSSCDFRRAIDTDREQCWNNKWGTTTQYLEYDLAHESQSVTQLEKNISRLQRLAREGKIDTTIILLPAISELPQQPQEEELRRRELELHAEQVIHEVDPEPKPVDSTPSTSPNPPYYNGPKASLQACYQSLTACETATTNCSGHGSCRNKYGADSKSACFACHCIPTKEGESTTHWGGLACQKIDVSSPFWLLTGFTIVMTSAVAFCIYLLFKVGEEKLPGVIGAGVSRGASK